jgi:hypothetical protein
VRTGTSDSDYIHEFEIAIVPMKLAPNTKTKLAAACRISSHSRGLLRNRIGVPTATASPTSASATATQLIQPVPPRCSAAQKVPDHANSMSGAMSGAPKALRGASAVRLRSVSTRTGSPSASRMAGHTIRHVMTQTVITPSISRNVGAT